MQLLKIAILSIILSETRSSEDRTKDLQAGESRIEHHNLGHGESHRDLHRSDENQHDKEGYHSQKKYSHGDQGKHGKSFHKTDYGEDHLKKSDNHEHGNHYKHHDEQGKTLKSAKFGEKEGHKKGHKTRGYHNKFLKDEYHREHKFYDNYHKKGSFKKHGDYSNKYGAREGGHKRGGNKHSSYSHDEYGKKGHHNRGHYEDENQGRNSKRGHDKYYKANEDYGRSGGGDQGRQYHYGRRYKH